MFRKQCCGEGSGCHSPPTQAWQRAAVRTIRRRCLRERSSYPLVTDLPCGRPPESHSDPESVSGLRTLPLELHGYITSPTASLVYRELDQMHYGMRGFSALLLSALFELVLSKSVIVPGAIWYDTDGNEIQAHGAGILQVEDTYYWFGEDKAANSALFSAVSCYSSTDLVNWERQDNALTPESGTNISSSDIVERPKVIYNEKNDEYVMWFHSDNSDYGLAMVGVATADTPCGPYSYRGSFNPLGAQSRDEGVFLDDDQTAYLLYASDNNQDFKIAQMDSDYYNVTEVVSEMEGATLEAPGMVKRDGVYWLFASHTSGWAPNPNKYFYADSISGTWSSQADIAPEDTNTYYSQNAYDMLLGTNAIYMGDRWDSSLLGNSRYMWYPLSWASGDPEIVYADLWTLDLDAGTYTVLNGTVYDASAGTLSGSAVLLGSSYTYNGHEGVGYLGSGGSVSLNVTGIGADQWLALYYANGDSTWRNVTISVNGGSSVVVDQPDTGGGHVVFSVPVQVYLNDGYNSITIGANQTNYAGDLYEVVVYTQT
ncbi:carbohydrate-binding module family 35 protein [Daedalea quercina L-15889]|uniref:Carbohydrate-binding module family 35 protein n=1 Tax=Daedalea quercina L-15889 TaxID=1314783 RepID=A0A165STL1_9APHY|nr:carbohydrate-binding module family 35 protein [Daedalea quercina L-15889]